MKDNKPKIRPKMQVIKRKIKFGLKRVDPVFVPVGDLPPAVRRKTAGRRFPVGTRYQSFYRMLNGEYKAVYHYDAYLSKKDVRWLVRSRSYSQTIREDGSFPSRFNLQSQRET